ncbi:PTS system, fructose subfamily, IIA component domain protein, partial [Vibrio parahaemolyticus EKP-028]
LDCSPGCGWKNWLHHRHDCWFCYHRVDRDCTKENRHRR